MWNGSLPNANSNNSAVNLFNNSFGEHSFEVLPRSSKVTLVILNILFATVGSLGNIVVQCIIIKSSNLRGITDFFIFSLATADLIVTGIRQPLMVYDLDTIHVVISDDRVATVFRTFSYISTPASLTCMFAVTLDRFIAIRSPFHYCTVVTQTRASAAIALCWCSSITIAVLFAFLLDVMRYLMWCYIVIVLLATIAIYAYLFLNAKKHQNCIAAQVNYDNIQQQLKKDKKTTKTIAVVVGVFLSFYMPFLVYPIVISPKAPEFYHGFFWVHSICLWNSSINPFIYFFRNSRYLESFKKILRLRTNTILPAVATSSPHSKTS